MFPLQAILNWRVWAGIGLIAALVYGWAWHEGKMHEAYKDGYVAAKTEDTITAQELTARLQKEKDDALKAAETRYHAALDAAARLQSDVDRMRLLLSDAERRIATAPEAAVREYAAAANAVFGNCVEEYRRMAVAAQGHADDVQTLIDAWPKK